jgi:hypothetical protein
LETLPAPKMDQERGIRVSVVSRTRVYQTLTLTRAPLHHA